MEWLRRASELLGTAVLSAVLGWTVHAWQAPQPAAAPAVRDTGASAAQPLTPAVVVSSDGLASLHVERMPVEWVLAQIARQHPKGALLPSPAGSRPAPAATAGTRAQPAFVPECAATAYASPAQAERLLQRVRLGTEEDRAQGLLQARDLGLTVPAATLKTLFETDASERVRLLAFEQYLEATSGDTSAVREALQAALYVPSAAIQREAQRRLDELTQGERIDAASPQVAGR
ncbi:hypothetical protein [Azohydromonas aeria]|uniref:hypothetical protein n=1 Tax=Azohydromonas aeria TaxID=2590212 RepID=UPI0012F75790|nr:hypothetical protein [Azohydromonas aeria]